MADSVIRPGAEQNYDSSQPSDTVDEPLAEAESSTHTSSEQDQKTAVTRAPAERIIWTPGFILLFVLVLVLGVSGESILTQAWSNGLYNSTHWLMQTLVILLGAIWLMLGIVTRSRWIRTGCIFGGLSVIFMTLNIITTVEGIGFAPLDSYINVATCMALLGAYIGLSVEGVQSTAWDRWLYLFIPSGGVVSVILAYFLTPQASILTVENAIATAAMFGCVAFWWLRISCWKARPGATLLFGLAPAILLTAGLLNTTFDSFFMFTLTSATTNSLVNANNYFFAQLAFLILFLGGIRLIKSELAGLGTWRLAAKGKQRAPDPAAAADDSLPVDALDN